MKKVINVNFQGRVIPIEESAQEMLQRYIERLRKYFAAEEGAEEIINDIEGRIAELFSERLKKGNICITDADVQEVIAGMGRPEDFEAAESPTGSAGHSNSGSTTESAGANARPGRFYRNADDRIIGGVASGLANFLGIDPVVMRIIFVLLFGALFWVYILLWIIVPSQSLQSRITKRLFRSTDQKVLGGVCGGLAAYFDIAVWIPRLIFALPILLGIVSNSFHFWDSWHFWFGPRLLTGSLSGTLFITYLILWIAVPYATTAAQKLEMRGERVDLESIRNTIKEDLGNVKGRAKNFGKEVRETAAHLSAQAKELGQTTGEQTRQFVREAAPVASTARRGIADIIALLIKIFLLFIAGIFAITLFVILISMLVAGYVAIPFGDFLLEGPWQHIYAWGFLFLFLAIPLIALLTWLIRRIMGVRSKRHYLGYAFGILFLMGLFSTILLGGSIVNNFKYKSGREEEIPLKDSITSKLFVHIGDESGNRDLKWWKWEKRDDSPFESWNSDSIFLNTVKIEALKSADAYFHVTRITTSRGKSKQIADALAGQVNYPITVGDSSITLPEGFYIMREQKFRNQQARIVIQVPVGKRIRFDKGISRFAFFNIRINNGKGFNVEMDDEWNGSEDWSSDTDYIMTDSDGLIPIEQLDSEALKRGIYRKKEEAYPDGFSEDIRKKMDSVEKVRDSLRELLRRKKVKRQEQEDAGDSETQLNVPRIPDPAIHILSRLF
jgi:phage shock protein PspC (stress-responsive transcriptional regulator)